MSDKKHETNAKTAIGRRAFFRKSVVGAGALGVAAATVGGKSAPAQAAAEKGSTYRETEHVKTYYKLANF